jgi:hypothetical protein
MRNPTPNHVGYSALDPEPELPTHHAARGTASCPWCGLTGAYTAPTTRAEAIHVLSAECPNRPGGPVEDHIYPDALEELPAQ